MIRVAAAVLVRPGLWLTTLRQVRHLARRRWWTRPPFMPLPDRDYMRFRAVTQYGDPDHRAEPADVLTWLAWCREHREITRAPRGQR